MASRYIASVLFLGLLVGCESFGNKPEYVTLIDQVYLTRGASEARLGSLGIEDDSGKDSFERFIFDANLINATTKYIRANMAVTIHRDKNVKGGMGIRTVPVEGAYSDEEKSKRKFGLAIIDLDKADLIQRINQRPELLDFLRKGDNCRIVTANAVFTGEYVEEASQNNALNLKTETKIKELITGEIEVLFKKSESTTIQPGSIYAYQMSHIGWDKTIDQIIFLKTDRPWVADRFYVTGVVNSEGKSKAEPGF